MSPGTCAGAMTITSPSPIRASASGTSIAALGGSSFCAQTMTATTAIHSRLITSSATSTAISPMLEPRQHSP